MDDRTPLSARDTASADVAAVPHELLLHRIRSGAWIIVASILFFALLDALLRPQLLAPLYLMKLGTLAIVGLCLALLPRARSHAAAAAIALVAFAAACFVPVVTSVVTHDTTTTLALCAALSTGAATMIPWGTRPQIVAAAVAALAAAANGFIVRGWGMSADLYPGGALLVTLAVSIYLAHALERQRRALAHENHERGRAERRLAEALDELQDLWNDAPCGYHLLDAEGRFVRMNDTELAWLGYAREEVVGKLQLSDVLTPASLEACRQGLPLLIQRGWVRDVDCEMVRKDGSVLPVLLSSTARLDAGGRLVESRSAVIDNRARKELERRRDEFFAMAAHDIRNPTSTVLAGLELLQESGVLGEETRETFDAIRRSANLLLSLVGDYLDYAKIEAGQIRLSRRPLQLGRLLHEVTRDLAYEAEKRGVTLVVEKTPEVPLADADPLALERVFKNLVGNALKFTPPGGRVTLRLEQRADELLAAVHDTGPGIAPEEIPKLFVPYEQTATGMKKTGSGLGLFVVKSLVEAHGGRVQVESHSGRGTTFFVTLPPSTAAPEAAA